MNTGTADAKTATLSEFAVLANFKLSHVRRLRDAGRLVLTDDGKSVLVAESMRRIAEPIDSSKPVSLYEFAVLASLKLPYVKRLRAAGQLVLADDGKSVLVAESMRRIAEPIDPTKPVSSYEFAILAGYKQSYVNQLRDEGRLVLAEDGKAIRVAESMALIHGTRDPRKDGVRARHAAQRAAADATGGADSDDAPEQGPVDPVYDSHAQRRAKALADKEEELAAKARRERLIEEGRLLWRDQVEPAIGLAFGRLRQALESTAHELSPELAAIDDEDRVRAVLTDRFERLLGNLSRDLAAMAQQGSP